MKFPNPTFQFCKETFSGTELVYISPTFTTQKYSNDGDILGFLEQIQRLIPIFIELL